VPRRGVVLLLAVVAAGGIAAALVLPDEEERQGRPPPAATESPRPTETETETAPPAEVTEPEAPAPGGPDGPRLVIGFVDDPSFRWRPYRAQMLDSARAAGARLVRAMVYWHRMAPRRPAAGEPPFDGPRLFELDELVASTAERGMEVMLTIWGTPAWANGGEKPNRPPHDLDDLREFARGLAARYPQVRRYSVWNEPNLEQFLAPQFDAAGQSVAVQLYAELFRAAAAGIREGNPDALVAAGETSARGRDVPSTGPAQDSHSPARFARLLSEVRPPLAFDAWAHHPFPTSPDQPPDQRTRFPTVTLLSLGRFGRALDDLFGRRRIPLWVTEYAHETQPEEQLGVPRELQAAYAEQALSLVAAVPRVELFVWFTFRDDPTNRWESGLLDRDGRPKPAYARFAAAARELGSPG
jgi:hypothetical protein